MLQLPVVSSLLGYLFTTVARNSQTAPPKAAPTRNQPFPEKWVNFGKYRIRPDVTQTVSRFPPLAVKQNETTLFRKPLNINELWSSKNQLRFINTQFLGIDATRSIHCILDTQGKNKICANYVLS